MIYKSKIFLIFSIYGQLNLQEVTNTLGIQPSLTWKKGELKFPKSKSRAVFRTDAWQIKTAEEEDGKLENHFQKLFDKLKGKESEIFKLSQKARSVFECCILFDESMPELILAPDLVQKIALYGAALEFDLINCNL